MALSRRKLLKNLGISAGLAAGGYLGLAKRAEAKMAEEPVAEEPKTTSDAQTVYYRTWATGNYNISGLASGNYYTEEIK